jgi:hypothetical protein
MNLPSDFMIRLKSYIISLLLGCTIFPAHLSGQNIFDASHSREFAHYLMQSHQFKLAEAEWERVLFFSPADTTARLNLIKSLRLGENPAEGWNKLNTWYPTGSLSRSFALEAVNLTLLQGDFSSFESVLTRSPSLNPSEKADLKLGAWLMEGSWINLTTKNREVSFPLVATDPRLMELYSKTKSINRKSPAVSLALSSLVPGLGKIYSNDWKDGLFSLLFVATNAWQSYRGFSNNGVSSVTGWIFGSLAAGFYTANLFGSWKSARVYNAKQTDRIRHEAESIILTR